MSALSKYNKTLELQSIAEDKSNNIFSSEEVFKKILDLFLRQLKKKEDKKLAIEYLISQFPNNSDLINLRASLNEGVIRRILQTFSVNDFGLMENKKINLQYDRLYNVMQNKDWISLHQLLEERDFFVICRFPTSLQRQKHIFEKLQHHGFRIIELMLQCRNTSFQLNSIILKNLIFFFFLPKELEINDQEKTGLFQILGEILCNSWIQFEYHYQQLQQKNQDQLQLKALQEILNLLKKDLKILHDSIIQLLNKLLNNNTTGNLNFLIVENLIEKLLPINFDLQNIFYLMCFYCLISFDNHYRKILAQNNKVQKYMQLDQYIQCRVSENNQLNMELINRVQSYYKNQCVRKDELDKWKIWSFSELIEIIIEEKFLQSDQKIACRKLEFIVIFIIKSKIFQFADKYKC
ncbi:unnamed protein product (macronuclear) [Paramecium tetraurelia]|uniref:Uncharacterized protein n=1 Tax=Paramecium tetraurelia TaxID=5888 RepID=A0D1M2_PARTE|nr:uncharacterized protein GSPATT00012463001 [Paramecium tetraurelia]CAK76939.1 unnamed protein product [Paramecium tetraurelia]|eukprot:XP_001444336.1 hypothetical protein (macronuclear) [Paramecium tetraurelia strain d4-2]